MKNITFDESSVLNEFMKIAQKDGLIKQADFNPSAMALKQLNEYSAKLSANPKLTDEQRQAMFVKAVGDRAKWVGNVLRQYKVPEAQAQEVLQRFNEEASKFTILTRSADWEVELEKNAKQDSKLYDVSGETGESLIGSAHPGGTKTEVTNSKTKENLVETVIEQQKRDLEVARKVPKGTYAMLVDLRNKLSKMGLDKHLGELNNMIVSVASVDEVTDHTLVTLADHLDALGFKKAADEVDQLLKKKIAQSDLAQQLKQEVLVQLQSMETPNAMSEKIAKPQMLREWQSVSPASLYSTFSAANTLLKRWGRSFPALGTTLDSVTSKYVSSLSEEGAVKKDVGIAGDKSEVPQTPEVPLAPLPLTKAQQRRIGWKKLYNQTLKNIAPEVRKQYGLVALVPNAQKDRAFLDALQKVQSTGAKTLSEFASLVGAEKAPVAPGLTPPTLPAPPPTYGPTPGDLAVRKLQVSGLPMSKEMMQDVQRKAEQSYSSLSRFFAPDVVQKKLNTELDAYIKDLVGQYLRAK